MSELLRIAVLMPKFKWNRMNLDQINPDAHGIELTSVDLDSDLQPYDGILHKLTYELVAGRDADVARISSFIEIRPDLIVIEPIAHIRIFIDRLALQAFFQAHPLPPCAEYCAGILLTPDVALPFGFPILVKSVVACGTAESHFIGIFHTRDQLTGDVIGSQKVIAFPFVPHYGAVFKCYSLGDHSITRAAGSIVCHGSEAIQFDSQKPLPEELRNHQFSESVAVKLAPTEEELGQVSAALRNSSGVHLIGFDLLKRESDGKLVLVDFNYFPCFKNIEDVPGKVAAFIKEKAKQKR
jgi:hypothetical protein